jgi:NAD(P)-dependent dehydrogenase (short-subunit alcohol dehydrogenase family)
MDLQLAGATALVTGASRGIGAAVAECLADEGCSVVVNARGAAELEAFAKRVGERTGSTVIAHPGDMGDVATAQEVVDDAIRALGSLDILVTCAGSVPGGLVTEIGDAEWRAGLELKLLGYVRCCRAVLPYMAARGSGSIVMVVGNAGLKASPWELAAGVANAANINFASAIADQYGSSGVRVNTVNPGPVATSRWPGSVEGFAHDRGISEDRAREIMIAALPPGRVAEAEEVASVVTFLASPRASYVNGAHLLVDGGQRKALLDL